VVPLELPNNEKDLYIEVPVTEEEDWDYARNKQVLLKSPIGEWSSSVFSCGITIGGEDFFGPNRDYPYQGLLVSKGTDVYKILDAMMFAMKEKGSRNVRVSPLQATYYYTWLEVLISFERNGLRLDFDREGVRMLPLIDIRGLDKESRPEDHSIDLRESWLITSKDGIVVRIGPFEMVERGEYFQEWTYKLGSGFRYKDDNGNIRFVKESRRVLAPAVCTVKGRSVKVMVDGVASSITNMDSTWMKRLEVIMPELRKPTLLRLCTLRNFGLDLGGLWFPEAGCWWFRTPGIRDALEGILNNFEVYTRLFHWEARIKSLATMLLKVLGDIGTLPNFIGSGEHSADAPPLLLYLCSRLGGDLLKGALRTASGLIERMKKVEGRPLGPPVLKDGLVACAPFQSWTDSRLEGEGRPSRLPYGWDISKDEWSLPRYYLPEINGYWIRTLRSLRDSADAVSLEVPDNLDLTLYEMEYSFKKAFWDGVSLASIIDSETKKSEKEPTSMGLAAISTAEHLFTNKEIEDAYAASRKILVGRRLRVLGETYLPFGIIISGRVLPYLGDAEYHRSVVWPRETPYLIHLLERLGLKEEINGLLLNSLDQMLSESTLLYSNEIFGLPIGRNPCPSDSSENVIPLKNPAQYWSHWCDPYVNRFFRII
jgi:hypothetical protein